MNQMLCCQCLNIKISIQSRRDKYDLPSINLQELFSSGVALVILEGGGLTKSLRCLCTTIKVDDWLVTKCWGCSMFTHAVNMEENCIIVNNQMKVFSSNLQNQEQYSPLFKLLVPSFQDLKEITSTYGIKYEGLVQEMVNNFLLQEKKNMEERIRQFSEKQYYEYNQLQGQIRKDKMSILSLLEKVEEPKVDSPIIPIAPMSEALQLEQKENETVPSLSSSYQHRMSRTAYLKKHFVRKNRPHRSISQPQAITANSDSYGIFDLEGMDLGDDSQWYSSDNDTDVESNTQLKEETANNMRNKKTTADNADRYAKSLPIDVPWSAPVQYSDEELEEVLVDPSQIAANIQALSLSMCEKVWDRPSRQLDIRGLIENHANITDRYS